MQVVDGVGVGVVAARPAGLAGTDVEFLESGTTGITDPDDQTHDLAGWTIREREVNLSGHLPLRAMVGTPCVAGCRDATIRKKRRTVQGDTVDPVGMSGSCPANS